MKYFVVFRNEYKKFINLINNKMSIRNRLLLFFSILIILPLLMVSIISYNRFSSYAERITVKSKFDMSQSAMDEINIIKDRDEQLSDQVILSQSLQEALISGQYTDGIQRYNDVKSFNNLLSNMVDSRNVNAIAIIGTNSKEYITPNIDLISVAKNEDVKSLLKNPDFVQSKGNIVWIPLQKNIFASPYDSKYTGQEHLFLYIVRKINNLKNPRVEIGKCIVQFVYDRLSTILKNTAQEDGEFCILTDINGVVMCQLQSQEQIGRKISPSIWTKIQSGFQGSFYNTINGRKYLMLFIRSKISGWCIVQAVPYDNLLKESKNIRNITIVTMLICLMAAMFLSVVFSRNITNPIIRLKKMMVKFASGNLKSKVNTDRSDEIGQLLSSFNFMTEEIQNLLKKIDEEHKQRHMLELNMLEYQINPHFLYNTLDSINWMAHKSGQKEIGEMVTALARFFRIGLSRGKEFIRVKDEIEHANNYLIITKMRYKDCFEFRFNIKEEILNCRTIKLILQPILENAIKHGLNKQAKSGMIEVKGWMEENIILLTVTDNGYGIETNKLLEIQKTLHANPEVENDTIGIGLINVNQRIKLNFGSEYGLEIDSVHGEWTCVTARIPFFERFT